MKNKFSFFLMSLFLSLAVVSCEPAANNNTEDPDPNKDPEPDEVELSVIPSADIAFEGDGGEATLQVKCNADWEVESSADWCKVEKLSDKIINVTADKNPESETLKAVITITAEDQEVKINVSQSYEWTYDPNSAYGAWVGTWNVKSTSSLVLDFNTGKYTKGGSLEATVYIQAVAPDLENNIAAETVYLIWGLDYSSYRYQAPNMAFFDAESGQIAIASQTNMGNFESGETLAYLATGCIEGMEGAEDTFLLFEEVYAALTAQISEDKSTALMVGEEGVLDSEGVEYNYSVNSVAAFIIDNVEEQIYYPYMDASLGYSEDESVTLVQPFTMSKTSNETDIPTPAQTSVMKKANKQLAKPSFASSFLKISSYIK